MESGPFRKLLYSTPLWTVFSHILQHPEKRIKGAFIVKAIPIVSKTAIYDAIQKLLAHGVLIPTDEQSAYELNQSLAWVRSMAVTDSLMILQPLVNRLSDISSKVILFGSRARGDYTSDSDYDLLVVSASADVRRVINKTVLARQIQLLLKTPEEWLDLYKTDPELYRSVQKGIVLWDRK